MSTPERPNKTMGAEAAERWLAELGLKPVPHWFVEIAILGEIGTRFDLNIYEEEWGFAFHHDGRGSWIRVTDFAFPHGKDDFGLLSRTPELAGIRDLLSILERDHGLAFRLAVASVHSNIPAAAATVRDWLLRPPAPP